MTDIDFLLNKHNPKQLSQNIAKNLQNLRISQNLTQNDLSERSGVTLSSLKRFEQKAEISLTHLLKLAISLDSIDGFENLFTQTKIDSIDDFLEQKNRKEKKRVRK